MKDILKDNKSLLEFLVENMNGYNECKVSLVFEKIGTERSLELSKTIKELESLGYASTIDLETIKVYPKGVEFCRNANKNRVFKLTKGVAKKIFYIACEIIIGVLIALIVAKVI